MYLEKSKCCELSAAQLIGFFVVGSAHPVSSIRLDMDGHIFLNLF